MLAPRAASKRLRDVLRGLGLETNDEEVSTSLVVVVRANRIGHTDVAIVKEGHGMYIGRVMRHAGFRGRALSAVSEWQLVEDVSERWIKVRRTDNRARIIDTGQLEIAVVYSTVTDGGISSVCLPLGARDI